MLPELDELVYGNLVHPGTGFSTFAEIDFFAGVGVLRSALILDLFSENKVNELMENNIIPRL
jgi:hypothetical protein